MRKAALIAVLAAFLPAVSLADTATYEAHHRPAAELASLVGFALRGEAPALTADEKSSRVLITGPGEQVKRAVTLLGTLDHAPRPVTLEIALEMDDKDRPAVVWHARVSALSGVTARVRLESAPVPIAGGTLSALSGKFTATWTDEGWDVRAQLELSCAGAALPKDVRLTGAVRAPANKQKELARVLIAPGRVLVLKVGCQAGM